MSNNTSFSQGFVNSLSKLTPLIVGLVVTGVGAAFTHIYNFRQLQLEKLAALDKFRGMLTSERTEDREFAYAAFTALGYEQLALKIMAIRQDPAGIPVAVQISQTGDKEARKYASGLLDQRVLGVPEARVFLHIAQESDRQIAKQLSTALQSSGYRVMGIENIKSKAIPPHRDEVRYFHGSDKEVAENILKVLHDTGRIDSHAILSNLPARPGTIEVWYSASPH